MNKIIVVGSINNDLIISTDKFPQIGETITGNGFMSVAGGKGANQAVAAARLAGDTQQVSFIGAVGDDIFGQELKRSLATNGINTDFVRTMEDTPTGTAVIVLYKGDNMIILDPGANYHVTPEWIQQAEEKISEANILITQLEIPYQSAATALQLAKQHGLTTILDPAPAVKLDDDILSNVDIITPNESEAEIITGIKINSPEDAKAAAKWLLDKGIKYAIVTLGSQGVVYNSENEIIHKPAKKVNVVDTTSAGDSFTGAIAVALNEGKDIDTAIDFAIHVSSLVVQKKGAQPSLPYRKDIQL